MTVYFIGAGPGAADLITVRGQRLLSRCPVCLYAGSIMPDDLLALCPPDARVVDTGPLTLDQIIGEIADAHAAGLDVARLHSGDPSLYSALAEQCRRLDALGVRLRNRAGRTGFRGGRGRARARADRARRRADRDADAGRDAVDGDAAGGGPRDIVGARRDAGAASGRRTGRRDRPAAAGRRLPRRNTLCGGGVRELAAADGAAVHAGRARRARCARPTSPGPRSSSWATCWPPRASRTAICTRPNRAATRGRHRH